MYFTRYAHCRTLYTTKLGTAKSMTLVSPACRRAFVVGAYLPSGGAFMAYHLGRILERDFGIPTVAVMDGSWSPEIFEYDLRMPVVSSAELERQLTSDDLLVVNPVFSSRLYGWRLPGYKLCYAQGFSTFSLLDRRLDYYVAVSDFVASFLRAVYSLECAVIPPFIETEYLPPSLDWSKRPERLILSWIKTFPDVGEESLSYLYRLLRDKAPDIRISRPINGRTDRLPHRRLLSKLGSVRYFLSLSPTEGCPLVPLEAMAMNTVVFGYDGFGGRHYMRTGYNCAVVPFAEIERVAELITDVINMPDAGALIANRGRQTATEFTYEAFRTAWLSEFASVFNAMAARH